MLHEIEMQIGRGPREVWALLVEGFTNGPLRGQAAAKKTARSLLASLIADGSRAAVWLDGRRVRLSAEESREAYEARENREFDAVVPPGSQDGGIA